MNTLIVEDDASTAEFVAGAFKQVGYATEFAADGDDYLPKPFSVAELVARVQALLRRAANAAETSVLRVEDLGRYGDSPVWSPARHLRKRSSPSAPRLVTSMRINHT